VRPDILTRNVRDKCLMTVRLGVKDEAAFAMVQPAAKSLCSNEYPKFERHVEARQPGTRI
jgi:hypothetical protein